ncbi:MAG: hypothetical protein ACLTTH_13240 [Holdemanella porci]
MKNSKKSLSDEYLMASNIILKICLLENFRCFLILVDSVEKIVLM